MNIEDLNDEQINYLVGKICGLHVITENGKLYSETMISPFKRNLTFYSPVTDPKQCLEATPRCHVMLHWDNNGNPVFLATTENVILHENNRLEEDESIYFQTESTTELKARCLALIYEHYGKEISIL